MQLGKTMRAKLGGIWHTIKWVGSRDIPRNHMADIDVLPARNPTIRIRASLNRRDMLYAIIHESIHGTLPVLDEKAVENASSDLTSVLLRCGYRPRE